MISREWKDIKPGWYELIINLNENDPRTERIEIIEWLETNIEKTYRHCIYTWGYDEFRIKFRYQRDYVFARLRW